MERIAYRIYDPERKAFHYSGSTPSMLESFFRHTAVLNTFHKSEYQQFTGLEDCKGRDIYEGDVCEVEYMPSSPDTETYIAQVVFKDGSFTFEDGIHELWDVGSITYEPYTNGYHPLICEVIGNTYENPGFIAG